MGIQARKRKSQEPQALASKRSKSQVPTKRKSQTPKRKATEKSKSRSPERPKSLALKKPKSRATSKPKAGRQLALVVGISNYPAPIPILPAVAADVREMAKLLKSKEGVFPSSGVTTLTDRQATRAKVRSALRSAFSGAADETVFVYLAGHGAVVGGGYYFITHDTDPDRVPETGVPLTEIKALFDRTKSRRVFLWLDFCHSGGVLARRGGPDDVSAIRRSIGVVSGHGKIIVAACSPAQSAHEDSALGHGLFTHALLRGLKGDAKSAHGEVTAPSLYEYIARQIKHPQQQPVFFGEMSGLIVLMHYPERAGTTAAWPPKAKSTRPKMKVTPKAGGTWVMLGDHFLRADVVRHRPDNTIEVRATTTSGEEASVLAGLRSSRLRGRTSMPFAANDDAHLVRVQGVESEVTGGRQNWMLTLVVEDTGFGGGSTEMTYNMNGKSYTPEVIAQLRAGLVLLNDPAPRSKPSRGYSAEDSLPGIIEGSGRYPVGECVIRSVYASHGTSPNWRAFARLRAVFLLKATGTVEHVLDLTIGAVRAGRVAIKFRGRRPVRGSGSEATTIKLDGSCPLR